MILNKNRILGSIGFVIIFGVLILLKILPSQGKSAPEKDNKNATAKNQTMSVRYEIVQAEKLGGKVMTVGTLLPNEEVDIRSEISGKVEQIGFQEGGRVQKGDILVKLNDAELQAQFTRAQYRQTIAEQEAERQRQLFDKQLTTQEKYNDAANEFNIAKAEFMLIQAQLAKSVIRAPFNGSIGLRYISEGSYLTPSTRIATLQDISKIKLEFSIPEKYASVLRIGDKISFTVQGVKEVFEGRLYALESEIDTATRTRRARALCPNSRGLLIPGAAADVEAILQENDTLTIPSYALIPELKGHRVFVFKSGKAISQSVKIGIRTDTRVEITEGLQVGDSLITSAILQLRPGMPVSVENN